MGKVLTLMMTGMVMSLLVACANTYRGYGHSGVIIDEHGVDMEQFHNDLAECEQYAVQVPKGERAAGEAVEGAAAGGAIGAIFNGSEGAARGAGTGAVLGGLRGARSAEYEKQHVIRQCLAYRGYRILN